MDTPYSANIESSSAKCSLFMRSYVTAPLGIIRVAIIVKFHKTFFFIFLLLIQKKKLTLIENYLLKIFELLVALLFFFRKKPNPSVEEFQFYVPTEAIAVIVSITIYLLTFFNVHKKIEPSKWIATVCIIKQEIN